jgi:hypothetical protein
MALRPWKGSRLAVYRMHHLSVWPTRPVGGASPGRLRAPKPFGGKRPRPAPNVVFGASSRFLIGVAIPAHPPSLSLAPALSCPSSSPGSPTKGSGQDESLPSTGSHGRALD